MTESQRGMAIKLAKGLLGRQVESGTLKFTDGRAAYRGDVCEKWRSFDPHHKISDAMMLVYALRDVLEIETRMGVLRGNCCVELSRWRDRSAEGIPGDPHTHRSRETFVLETGPTLEGCIVAAALRAI